VDGRGEASCSRVSEEGQRVRRRTWEVPQGYSSKIFLWYWHMFITGLSD